MPTERKPKRVRTGPEFTFTREGRVFLVATIGIGLGAVNTGNNLLYLVLGLMLGLLLTSGVLSEVVLRGMRIDRLRAPRLFARRPGLFELEVTNEKRRLASTSFEVGDVAEDDEGPVTGYVVKLEPGASARVVVTRTPERRGELHGTHVRIRTRFPFGLLEKSRTRKAASTAIVFPALVPVTLPKIEPLRRGFEMPVDRRGHGSDVIGVRERRDGDSLRDVHWRRSAALGRIVSRERAAELDDEVRVFLDTRPGDAARFEADVSVAASIAVAAVAEARPVLVRTRTGTLGRARSRGELDELLTALALVQPDSGRGVGA